MIEIKNLYKNYGNVKAVQGIDFSIKGGEIVGFLGSNGAGKSTTLKILSGYLNPTSGQVSIDGLNINNHSHEIKKIIGYLPESNPLYYEMMVYDLLKFTANIRGINSHDFKDSLDKVVERCGLKGVLHKNIGSCSKGYKQRVGLACAMIHDPKILILDEPVTGLDFLPDVDISSNLLADNKSLLYDATASKWKVASVQLPITSINDIPDVDTTGVISNYALGWKASENKWKPQEVGDVIRKLGDLRDVDLGNMGTEVPQWAQVRKIEAADGAEYIFTLSLIHI